MKDNENTKISIKLQIFNNSDKLFNLILSWRKISKSEDYTYFTGIHKTKNTKEMSDKIRELFPEHKILSKMQEFLKSNAEIKFQDSLNNLTNKISELDSYKDLFYEEKRELKIILLKNDVIMTDNYIHNILYVYTNIDTHYFYNFSFKELDNIVIEINKEYKLIKKATQLNKEIFAKILFSEKAASGLIHEALGHLIEEDLFSSGIKEFLNQSKIFPQNLRVYDDPTIKGLGGSYVFDDEGTKAEKKIIIKDGKLVNLIGTSENCKFSGLGNARCVDYTKPLLSRQSNFYIEGSDIEDKKLFKEIEKDGYYIISAGAGNFYGLKFDLEVKLGYYFSNGNIKYFKNCKIEGNTIDLFKNMINFGKNTVFFNMECCHYNQYYYEVSVGTPKILIDKIKLTTN